MQKITIDSPRRNTQFHHKTVLIQLHELQDAVLELQQMVATSQAKAPEAKPAVKAPEKNDAKPSGAKSD